MLRIADCTPADADDVYEIESACIECAWTRADIAAALGSDDYVFIKAVSDGRTIGYAGARIVLDTAEICNIAVREDCRRRGAGRRLTETIVRRAELRGARTVFLEVAEDNAPALALYRSLGFTEVYERKKYYGAKSAYVMRLSR